MANIGTAVIYGINGEMTGAAALLQSASFTHQFDSTEVKDAHGNTVGIHAYNERDEVEIEFIPTGAVTKPQPLAPVTLTGFDGGVDGDYRYTGGWSFTPSPTEAAKVKISLKRYAAIA